MTARPGVLGTVFNAGSPQNPNTVYDTSRPWQTHEEWLVTNALSAQAAMSPEQIREIRPPLPRVQLFPPRFGYRNTVPGIRDIVRLDALYPGARVDYSGAQSGYSGSSFPALGVM
jgi:hypothetical protein